MQGESAELWQNGLITGLTTEAFVPSSSPAMQALERVSAEIAATDVPVLLVGERGSGKGVLAQRIHRQSLRQGEVFVSLSPQSLAAWSGNGHSARSGDWMAPFLAAGTVFVDEVGELPPEAQATMLEMLSGSERQSGARLICSTRIHLEDEVRLGRFREDLYYRISGICLRIPPLRHRREDIPALAKFFLAKYAALFGRVPMRLAPDTLSALTSCPWPGNVRELENVLKSAAAVRDSDLAITAFGFGRELAKSAPAEGFSTSLKQAARAASLQAERELILKVLSRTRWNRKRAAQELQISYKALLYKLKQTGLDNRELTQATGGTNS
jgi:two-component system response regulator AtoC